MSDKFYSIIGNVLISFMITIGILIAILSIKDYLHKSKLPPIVNCYEVVDKRYDRHILNKYGYLYLRNTKDGHIEKIQNANLYYSIEISNKIYIKCPAQHVDKDGIIEFYNPHKEIIKIE